VHFGTVAFLGALVSRYSGANRPGFTPDSLFSHSLWLWALFCEQHHYIWCMGQRTAQYVGYRGQKGQGTFRLKFSLQSAKNQLVFDSPRLGTIEHDWTRLPWTWLNTGGSAKSQARKPVEQIAWLSLTFFFTSFARLPRVKIKHWDLVGSGEISRVTQFRISPGSQSRTTRKTSPSDYARGGVCICGTPRTAETLSNRQTLPRLHGKELPALKGHVVLSLSLSLHGLRVCHIGQGESKRNVDL